MKKLTLALLTLLAVISLQAADEYPLGPDSKAQPGVPKGDVMKFTFDQSTIFPGTTRDYFIYIPKQYDATKPACLMVFQDGNGKNYEAPTVLDNLIHKKELPPIIAVMVMHGRVKALNADALDRFNRSYEYDGLGDAYVRFLLEELLPDAEKQKAPDGRAIRFSKRATDRAIAGSSSGGIAAWTAAWERPDSFSRVFTSVGTYVGLRGGDVYPTLIRKFEPKPIRIFLQDGSADQNIYGGDWWMANQMMERALTFAGYEVNHAWGDGGHNGKHATAILPDAMRWLWKDWPAAPKVGAGSKQLQEILLPGEGWKLVAEGYKFTEGTAVNPRGEIFFCDVPAGKSYKVALDGKISEFIADNRRGGGQAFGADGRLYATAPLDERILAYDSAGRATSIADGIRGNDLVVAHNGNVYVTHPNPNGANTNTSRVWLIKPDGTKKVVDTGVKFSNGITVSPDQTLLYVADSRTRWVYSYQIAADGTLKFKQRYYNLHVPDSADDSGADGMHVDRDGRLYVATRMGIQVCDQAGRVNCIIPTPNGRVANLCFGGENFDTLYAACGDKVFKRKLAVKGANAWDAPNKPAAPRL